MSLTEACADMVPDFAMTATPWVPAGVPGSLEPEPPPAPQPASPTAKTTSAAAASHRRLTGGLSCRKTQASPARPVAANRSAGQGGRPPPGRAARAARDELVREVVVRVRVTEAPQGPGVTEAVENPAVVPWGSPTQLNPTTDSNEPCWGLISMV